MAITISVSEVTAHFPELLKVVLPGEEVILAENGHEIAHLTPSPQSALAPRVPGIDEGKIVFASDFEDHLPTEIIDAFYNPVFRKKSR
jgi:antitoxin (DNA-binding transcriptional repressor) of toxin-antitoxin stability system